MDSIIAPHFPFSGLLTTAPYISDCAHVPSFIFFQSIYSPVPGGGPSGKAEVPQLPGKSAKPLHIGQCCNIVLPRVIVSQLCVPPAGR